MHNMFISIIFYIFAAIAVLSALMVITQNNPVRCVLFLVVTFFSCSVLWVLMNAEFLALILVLVYVGAVMTLFLFVVMMLDIDVESLRSHFMRYLPFGLIIVALLVGLLLVAVPENWAEDTMDKQTMTSSAHTFDSNGIETKGSLSNTEQIGMALFTQYVYAFELAAVILLVAIISAITLAHRSARRSKTQDIVKQIMTDSRDRVQLISMKSEEK